MQDETSGPLFLLGLQRSGTTQAWNILQSQPELLWPAGEIQQILRPTRKAVRLQKRPIRTSLSYLRILAQSGDVLSIHRPPPEGELRKHAQWLRHGLDQAAIDNRAERDAFRQGLDRQEAGAGHLLVKMVNYGIAVVPDLVEIYPDARFVVVVRDLVCVCEGHIARGHDIEKTLGLCDAFARHCDALSQLNVPVHAFSFERFLAQPTDAAVALLRAAGFERSGQDKVVIQDRIRKRDHSKDGFHSANVNRCLRLDALSEHVRQDVNTAARARLGDARVQQLEGRLAHATGMQDQFLNAHAVI